MIAEALRGLVERRAIGPGMGDQYLLGGTTTQAGENVNAQTALKVAAVYACSRIIAEGVRAMPCRVLRDKGDGILREERESRLWPLLHDKPNPDMHAGELWEWVTLCLLLVGNAFLYLERDRLGRVVWLRPISPGRVQVFRHHETRRKYFQVSAADDREDVVFTGSTEDIIHIRGFSLDTLIGVSVIRYLAESIGRALSEDGRAGATMANNGRPSGILSVKRKLDDDGAKRLRGSWEGAHGGGKSGGTAVLEEDTTWQAVEMSSADLELVKQRSMSREDIAIGFGVPGDFVMSESQARLHYSTDATRDVRLVKYALMPWSTRIGQGLAQSDQLPWAANGPTVGMLLPSFDPRGLLRADEKARFDTLQVGINAGFVTPNEAREREDMDPMTGGDKLKSTSPPPALHLTPPPGSADPAPPPADDPAADPAKEDDPNA